MKNLVWLASYPRSGNTWFRIMLFSLLSESKQWTDFNQLHTGLIANSRFLFDELAGINSSDLSIDEINTIRPQVYQVLSDEATDQIYLKTHDKFFTNQDGNPVFPAAETFGCIYIIRNPLDVAVSNAHFFKRSIDQMIESMNDQYHLLNPSHAACYPILEERTGSWSQHVTSWMNSGLPLHIVKYEDLINQPFETLKKALEFLCIKFPDDSIRKTITNSSFENLKQSENLFGFRDKMQGTEKFFRTGKAGSWKDELSTTQINEIVNNHGEVMHAFGYLNDKNLITEK